MSWRIRLARSEDVAALPAIEEDAAELLAEEPSLAGIVLPEARDPQTYGTMIAGGHSLVAERDGTAIGFAATRAYGRELHLHELSVARAAQRQGIGTRLLLAVTVEAKNAGFRAVTLNTFRDIAWHAPFYARHGFALLEELDAHPRLAANLEAAVEAGLPRERRCAMIRFLG